MRDEIIRKMKETADDIFCHPELSLRETYSSRRLAQFLESEGFEVSWGTAGFETHLPRSGAAEEPSSGSWRNTMRSPGWGRCAYQSRREPAVRATGAGTISSGAPARVRRAH